MTIFNNILSFLFFRNRTSKNRHVKVNEGNSKFV